MYKELLLNIGNNVTGLESLKICFSTGFRSRWKILQGNRVEVSENQNWYFTNRLFWFENAFTFAITNDRVGVEIGDF